MYRPRREWAWDEQAEQAYQAKRAALADKGYVTTKTCAGTSLRTALMAASRVTSDR